MWSCCGCSDDATLSTRVEHNNNTPRGSTSVDQRAARSHQRIPHQRSEFGDGDDDTSPLEGIASASSHVGGIHNPGGGGGVSGFFGRGLRRADGLMFTHHNDSLSLAGANSHRHRQRWRRSPNGGIYLDNGDGSVSQSSSSSSGHFALTAIGNWLRLFWNRVLAKREDLFVWLGLCHEDPYLELQFQIYFYNSQRIVSMVFCISAFAFCLGGTALWVSTIDIFFVFWDCFGVLVWGVCAAMLVWLYRKHRVIVEHMDELSSHISGGILGSAGRGAARGDNDDSDDDDGDDGGDEHDDSRNGHSYNNKHNHSQQGGAPANASLFRLSTLSHSTRQFGSSPSSSRFQRRIARLEEELRWNTTWHERFLLVANMTSVWFSVGLTGAQGSCDYVREDRRVLDCRNAINTEGLMFMFVSAAVFLSQTRLSFSWPIFPVWAGAVIGVLKAAVPNIVDTYFASFAFLLVFELAVALGTLWIREWRRRADFENFIKRQDRAAEVNIVRLQTQRMLTVQLPPEVTRMLMVGHQQWKKHQSSLSSASSSRIKYALPLFPWIVAKDAVVSTFEISGLNTTSLGWSSRRSPLEIAEVMRRVFEALDGVRELFDDDGNDGDDIGNDMAKRQQQTASEQRVGAMNRRGGSKVPMTKSHQGGGASSYSSSVAEKSRKVSKYHCVGDTYTAVREVANVRRQQDEGGGLATAAAHAVYRVWSSSSLGNRRSHGTRRRVSTPTAQHQQHQSHPYKSSTATTSTPSSSSTYLVDDALLLSYSLHSAAVATRVLREYMTAVDDAMFPSGEQELSSQIVDKPNSQTQKPSSSSSFMSSSSQQAVISVRCGVGIGPVRGIFCGGSKNVSLYGQAHSDATRSLRLPFVILSRPQEEAATSAGADDGGGHNAATDSAPGPSTLVSALNSSSGGNNAAPPLPSSGRPGEHSTSSAPSTTTTTIFLTTKLRRHTAVVGAQVRVSKQWLLCARATYFPINHYHVGKENAMSAQQQQQPVISDNGSITTPRTAATAGHHRHNQHHDDEDSKSNNISDPIFRALDGLVKSEGSSVVVAGIHALLNATAPRRRGGGDRHVNHHHHAPQGGGSIASGSVNSGDNSSRIFSPQDPPASLPPSHVALDNHWQLRTGGPGESVGSNVSVNRAAAVVARATACTTKGEVVGGDLSVEHELCICCPELQFPEIDEESGTDRGDGSGAESANQSCSHHRGGGEGGGGLNYSRSRRSVSTEGGGGAHQPRHQQQHRQSIAFTVASTSGAEVESVLAEIGARVVKGDENSSSGDGLVRVADSTKSTTNATTTSATTGDDAAALYSTAIGSFLSYRWFTDERTETAYRSYTTHSATKADVIWTACSAALSLSCLFATLVYSSIQEHETIALLIASWVSCLALLMIAVLAPPPWFTSAMTSHLVPGGYATFARYLLSDAMIAQQAEYYYDEWKLWRVLDTPIAVLDHTSLRTVLYFVLWCMPMVSYATITFMVPSEGNTIGNSQLIWLIVMLNWSLVRPMWVRPVVAFAMDGVLCTAYFLRTFARFDTNPIARVTALYMEAAIFLYSGIVRLVLDSSMRAAFATELEAQQLKDILERDQKKLEGIVEMVATDGIASRFIEHSRRQRRDEVRRRRHNDGGLSSSLNAAGSNAAAPPLRQRVFREFAGWQYGAQPTTVTDRSTNSNAPGNHQLPPAAPPPPPQDQLANNSSTVSRSLNPLAARRSHEGDAGNMPPVASVASSALETIGGVVNGIPGAFLILDDDASRPITERGRGGAAVDELHVMVSPASPRTTTTNNNNNNNNNGRGGGTSAGRDEYLGESNGDYINSSTAQRARFLTSNETVMTTAPSTVQDEAIHPKKPPLQSDDGRQQLQLCPPVSSLFTLVAAQVTGAATVVGPPVVVINANFPTNRLHRATNSSASPPSPLSPRRDQHAIITHSNNSHQGDHHHTLVTMTANHLNDDGAHPLKSTAWSTSVWEVPIAIIRLDRNLSLATRQRTTTAVASELSTLRTSENNKSEGSSHRPREHRATAFKGMIPRLSIVSDGGRGYDDEGDDDEDEPAVATSTELSSPQRVVFDARRRSSGAEHLTRGGTTPSRRIASIPNNNVDLAAHQSTTAASTTLLGDTILTTNDDGAASSPPAALAFFSRASTAFDHGSGGVCGGDDEFVTRAHRIVGELAADWPQPPYMRLEVYKSTKYELRICVACLQGPRGSSDRKDADEERCFELLKFVAVVQQRLEAALPFVIPYGTSGPLSPSISDAATTAAGGGSLAVTVGSLIGSASRGGFSSAGAAATAGSMGMMAGSSTNQRAGWSITSRRGGGRGVGAGGGGESAMSGAAAASLSLFERSQVPSASHLSGGGGQQSFSESALLAQQQQRSHSSASVNDSPFATKVPAFRVMMHVGPLVGAVIGRGSVSYDYYGHAVVEACAVLDIADGLGAAVPPVLTSVKFANLCRLVALCDPLTWRSQVDHLLSIRSNGHAGGSSTTATAATSAAQVQNLIGSSSATTATTTTTGVATASVGGPTTSFGGSVNLKEPPPSSFTASSRRYLPCPRRVGVIPTLSSTILSKRKSSTAAPADGDADGGDTTCMKSSLLLKLGPDIHLRYMVGPQLMHLLPKKKTHHHAASASNDDVQQQTQQQQQLPHALVSSSYTTTHEMETTATMTAATTSGSGESIAAAVGGVEAADEYLSHCSASFGAHALRWWVGGQATPVDVVHVEYVAFLGKS